MNSNKRLAEIAMMVAKITKDIKVVWNQVETIDTKVPEQAPSEACEPPQGEAPYPHANGEAKCPKPVKEGE